MGNATTVTDTKTLWGENPDERNPCSTSICLNYCYFRVQSNLHSQFLHFFCLDNKNNTGGGGGGGETLPYKPIWDVPFFRVSFFNINS